MHKLIALTLINQGSIRSETEIEAFYKGVGLSGKATERVRGTFLVKEAKRLKSGEIIFETVNATDGHVRRISCSEVITVDGMEPERAINVAGFSLEGDQIIPLKKRGRKAKDVEDDDDDEASDAA